MIILITIYKFEPYTKINMWQVKHKTRSSFPYFHCGPSNRKRTQEIENKENKLIILLM